jgi:hypothetical protein
MTSIQMHLVASITNLIAKAKDKDLIDRFQSIGISANGKHVKAVFEIYDDKWLANLSSAFHMKLYKDFKKLEVIKGIGPGTLYFSAK